MTLNEILTGGGVGLLLILTLVEITPVKINPWSHIAKALGKAINGELIEKVDKITNDVKNLADDCEKREAITVRNRILRFSDEIYHDQKHSQESFKSVMSDITFYNRYCDAHSDFKNEMTVIASELIEDTYKKCLEEKKFV